jgi:hypothetical protein
MSDDSTVARRELLLGTLEKYARQGNLQLFRVGEWILVHRVAEADTIAAAQARMAPADVGRWRAARNATKSVKSSELRHVRVTLRTLAEAIAPHNVTDARHCEVLVAEAEGAPSPPEDGSNVRAIRRPEGA